MMVNGSVTFAYSPGFDGSSMVRMKRLCQAYWVITRNRESRCSGCVPTRSSSTNTSLSSRTSSSSRRRGRTSPAETACSPSPPDGLVGGGVADDELVVGPPRPVCLPVVTTRARPRRSFPLPPDRLLEQDGGGKVPVCLPHANGADLVRLVGMRASPVWQRAEGSSTRCRESAIRPGDGGGGMFEISTAMHRLGTGFCGTFDNEKPLIRSRGARRDPPPPCPRAAPGVRRLVAVGAARAQRRERERLIPLRKPLAIGPQSPEAHAPNGARAGRAGGAAGSAGRWKEAGRPPGGLA